MVSNEDYFRKYLDDPIVLDPTPVPQQTGEVEPVDSNVDYFRKFLNDPNA